MSKAVSRDPQKAVPYRDLANPFSVFPEKQPFAEILSNAITLSEFNSKIMGI